ncbi:ATP-binding cassette domain-containing protein [Caballeronia insecticola]|uniref:ATP-binding cassette domain-containing protein n=1 Tax=Caballeronia insecticola TaxID=758793 RepID=UPI001360B157|nr:ATP-binding cassette domain-containing protein [Caballeronia insecticola]
MVLSGINLQIDFGERVAVLGRASAGKTTLARAITGALPCRRGNIRFMGVEVTAEAAHARARRGIAYVSQARQVFSQLTVMQNMLVGAYAARLDSAQTSSVLETQLTYFKTLKPVLRELGGSLDEGQQQLLALARELMSEPKLLVLDEPSAGVQPPLLDEMVEVIEQVSSDAKLAVLTLEKDASFAARLSTRGYLMDSGRFKRAFAMSSAANIRELERELSGDVRSPWV